MPDPSDADLVERAQGGNVNAIGELYDRHHARIFRYVWMHVHDQHLAEDLTGEVFTRMVTGLSKYRRRGIPFQAWLYRIAHNLTVDHYRKAGHHELVPLYQAEGVSETNDPRSIVEQRLTAEKVRRVLDELKPLEREVVVLRFLTGLSLKEVARSLGKTVGAVKSLQHRGLVALRVALEDGSVS